MNMSDELGVRRLSGIHCRVDYLCEKFMYNEDKEQELLTLCHYCEIKEDLDLSVPVLNRKQTYINCSGIEWICRTRDNSSCPEKVLWNQYTLMQHEEYTACIMEILNTLDPRIAMLTMHEFHKHIKAEQPHMIITTHLGEQTVYPTYNPFKLLDDRFPLPPVGEELVPHYVDPVDYQDVPVVVYPKFAARKKEDLLKATRRYTFTPQCKCKGKMMHVGSESCVDCGTMYNKKEKKAQNGACSSGTTTEGEEEEEEEEEEDLDEELEEGEIVQDLVKTLPAQPTWNEFFKFMTEEIDMLNGKKVDNGKVQHDMNLLRAQALVNSKCTDLLKTVEIIGGVRNPCDFCQNLKRQTPDRIIECTGVEKLCQFKWNFLKDWPVCMMRDKSYNDTILQCKTKNRYKNLLNKVFSPEYIERAMKAKEIIDADLMILYPKLAPMINWYSALLYRFYWPAELLVVEVNKKENGDMIEVSDISDSDYDEDRSTPSLM